MLLIIIIIIIIIINYVLPYLELNRHGKPDIIGIC